MTEILHLTSGRCYTNLGGFITGVGGGGGTGRKVLTVTEAEVLGVGYGVGGTRITQWTSRISQE